MTVQTLDSKLEHLRTIADELLHELAEDARAYLELLEHLDETDATTETYEDIEAHLYAKVVTLKIHAAGVQEILNDVTDALPEDA